MSKIEGNVLLCVGKYVIDAKSIMGIFSLELSKPLRLEIENWKEEYVEILGKYLISNYLSDEAGIVVIRQLPIGMLIQP